MFFNKIIYLKYNRFKRTPTTKLLVHKYDFLFIERTNHSLKLESLLL